MWSSNSTPGYSSEENKNTNMKRYMHPYVHCSIIYNSQVVEATRCSWIDEWIKKIWRVCVCVCVKYYSAIKKNEILSFMTMWMDLQSIIFSETNQAEKDKYYTISLIWRIWKNKPNEQTEQNRNSVIENKQMVARGESEGGKK